MTAPTWLAVAVAGGAGSVCRLLVDEAVRRHARGGFPLGIFVVNVSGSLLIGLVAGALTGAALTVATVGFLGGYTTFSTWMLDTHAALTRRETSLAAANVLLSLAAGLAALHLGAALT